MLRGKKASVRNNSVPDRIPIVPDRIPRDSIRETLVNLSETLSISYLSGQIVFGVLKATYFLVRILWVLSYGYYVTANRSNVFLIMREGKLHRYQFYTKRMLSPRQELS